MISGCLDCDIESFSPYGGIGAADEVAQFAKADERVLAVCQI